MPRGSTKNAPPPRSEYAAGGRREYQAEHDDRHGHQDRRQGREAGRQQGGHAQGTGEATDAEHAVEAGHQRHRCVTRHLHGVHAHRHVHGAKGGAEQGQGERQQRARIGHRQQRHGTAQADAAGQDHRTAADPARQPAGQRHRQHRPRATAATGPVPPPRCPGEPWRKAPAAPSRPSRNRKRRTPGAWRGGWLGCRRRVRLGSSGIPGRKGADLNTCPERATFDHLVDGRSRARVVQGM